MTAKKPATPPAAIEKQSKAIKTTKSKTTTKQPGQTGKRGGVRAGAGRPVGAVSPERKALRELAQAHTEDAVSALAGLCTDAKQPGMVRVSAATALLDRGHGRPNVSVTVEGGPMAAVDPAALIALSEAMERSRMERRAIMKRRRQMGFTGD